jgi:hypothetical protein
MWRGRRAKALRLRCVLPHCARQVTAVEVLKLGQGGQVYMTRILGCSEKTVHNGLAELIELPDEPEYEVAIRKSGGGRTLFYAIYNSLQIYDTWSIYVFKIISSIRGNVSSCTFIPYDGMFWK